MRIEFRVGKRTPPSSSPGSLAVRLSPNTWDDHGFGTTFDVSLNRDGDWRPLGVVKIGTRGLRESLEPPFHTSFVELPQRFLELTGEYFSLGQGADYYERLVEELGTSIARQFVIALRDIAIVPGLFEEVSSESALQYSLMRAASSKSFDKYRDIIRGQREKRDFHLTYTLRPNDPTSPSMRFRVERSRRLPSNVHVLIGSNGTGKTTALSNIRWAFENSNLPQDEPSPVALSDRRQIAGLLSIGFSAFDTFPPQERGRRDQLEFRITNVRLPWLSVPQSLSPSDESASLSAKRTRDVEMGIYVRSETLGCLAERSERLLPALQLLADADPVLDRHRIGSKSGLESLNFSELSSGHKIAILTIASLVRYCEENTLVLLDEPESHLHPPLLGAVTRALSNLMTTINGLAIVATHSPVVLQEVPRRCAWIIWSSGGPSHVEQPNIETFGANLGVLTREIFDLELSKSGYHALLQSLADESAGYEEAIRAVDGEIGEEAKMLLRSMIRRRDERSW